jgi:hypothetical protein
VFLFYTVSLLNILHILMSIDLLEVAMMLADLSEAILNLLDQF